MQKLALNNFFGKLKKTEWVSGIERSKTREAEIETNFSCKVDFHYLSDEDELSDQLDQFKLESKSNELDNLKNVKNIFGEKSVRDRLIVFYDVFGLANNSKKFVSFLTVARKYSYNCVYIFHTIYPEKANWRTTLSQTNIYNIFSATVSLNNVRKILEGACIRKTSKYIPRASLCISRLFIELANRNDKVCLTLDCSNTNEDGRFRTDADNPDNQICYFNSANDEQVYNEFVSERIKTPNSENDFHFKILEVKSKTNKNISFDATNKLQQLNRNDTKRSRGRVKMSFSRERERNSRLSGSSRMFTMGSGLSHSSYSESATENDGWVAKRAKPGFLLKR